jgi:hypothetical protein
MVKFPISWEKDGPATACKADGCPYSADEILQSLKSGHYHFCLDEPSIEFQTLELVLERRAEQRNLWLWQVTDDRKWVWWIVVGSGASPFYVEAGQLVWRWLAAETKQTGESDEQYLDRFRVALSQQPFD